MPPNGYKSLLIQLLDDARNSSYQFTFPLTGLQFLGSEAYQARCNYRIMAVAEMVVIPMRGNAY
jgi:hypothetical protein